MKVYEITEKRAPSRPSKSYCKNTPKHKMSASWLASCKNRGLVSRDGDKSHKLPGGKRITVGGKKIKGAPSGPLPDWS
jgi:hypothetical protein